MAFIPGLLAAGRSLLSRALPVLAEAGAKYLPSVFGDAAKSLPKIIGDSGSPEKILPRIVEAGSNYLFNKAADYLTGKKSVTANMEPHVTPGNITGRNNVTDSLQRLPQSHLVPQAPIPMVIANQTPFPGSVGEKLIQPAIVVHHKRSRKHKKSKKSKKSK